MHSFSKRLYEMNNRALETKSQPPLVGLFLLLSVLYYVFTVAFEGPVRYFFSYLGVENFLYFRDFLLLAGVLVAFSDFFGRRRSVHWVALASIYIAIAYVFFSILMGRGLFHALIQFKVLLPLLFGMIFASYVEHYRKLVFWAMSTLCSITYSVRSHGRAQILPQHLEKRQQIAFGG
jgi:hypothetical protein